MENIYNENENEIEIENENISTDTAECTESGIDPKDPFGNFTEYREYNSDYREIVPQIDIPGCKIPFEPSKGERKKIRYFFNIAGAGITVYFLIEFIIFNLAGLIIRKAVMNVDGVAASDVSQQYLNGLSNFLDSSSVSIGLNMLTVMICCPLVFFLGSKLTGIKIGSYFRTKDLTFKAIISYFFISFFLRYIGGIAVGVFQMFFSDYDLAQATTLNSYIHPKTVSLAIVYTCIVAPVCEELICRGFLLKNLSRVSQRFGIIMSALLFGLLHGNMVQFLTAFIFGIFLAHIDIKHNSLIPSIIIHALSNMFSMIVSYSGVMDNFFTTIIFSMIVFGLAVIGTVLFFSFHKKDRMPFTMPHQKIRNGTAATSVFLIFGIAFYGVMVLIESFPELFTQFKL